MIIKKKVKMVITEVVKGREKEKKTLFRAEVMELTAARHGSTAACGRMRGETGVGSCTRHLQASSDVPEPCSEMLLSAWRHRQSMTQFYNICRSQNLAGKGLIH